MPAYTIPFAAPQRIAGPGNFTGPDISLPMYWPQNVVFTNGGKTRYCFCVNGAQAASGAADPTEKWPVAGGVPPYKVYIHVRKSTDGGATWAEVGTPNAKELPPQNFNNSPGIHPGVPEIPTLGFITLSCWQDGKKILVLRPVWDFVNYASSQPHQLVISVFDMTADDWAADLSTAADPNCPVISNQNNSDGWTLGDSPNFIVKRPSDGHIFALYKQTEFVDTRTSGSDLVIQTAGIQPSGNDLQVVAVTGADVTVSANSYAFQPTDAGLTVFISATSPAGWNPGGYLIQAVIGGQAQLQLAPQGLAGTLGASAGVWQIVGNNKVSSASHGPYTAADVNYGLSISGGTGFLPGNYIITGFDGSGNAILNQNVGTAGSTGGIWSESRLFTFGYFDRCYLSEFNGTNWLPARANVFGQSGVIQNFMPVGLALGDSSRIHCFCEQQFENLNYPPPVDAKSRNILQRTISSNGALQPIGTLFETDASDGNAASYFVGTPRTRPVSSGITEILLPWLYTRFNIGGGPRNPVQLNLIRFLSADSPVLASTTIASGLAPLNFDADQSAPCWVPVVNLNNGDLYLVTQGPSNTSPNNPTNNNIVLLSDVTGTWDAGVNIFVDGGNTQSLGAITANSLLGSAFIGIALSWNTHAAQTGDIPWGDPWYFEIYFGGCPKNSQGV